MPLATTNLCSAVGGVVQVRHGPLGRGGLVVTAANNAEKALLTPVGSPGVATNPVINSILSTPTIKLDSMVVRQIASLASVIHIDASGVGLDALGIDGSGNGTASVNLSHDLVVTVGSSELRYTDDGVVLDGGAAHIRVMITIHAVVNVRAFHVLGLVLLAGNIRNAMVVHVTVGSTRVSSIARSSMSAVDKSLDGRDHIAFLTLGLDLKAITKGRKSGMSPARSAINGDVLVQVSGEKSLLAVVERSGQILLLDVSVRLGSLHLLSSGEAVVKLIAVSAGSNREGRDDSSGKHFNE